MAFDPYQLFVTSNLSSRDAGGVALHVAMHTEPIRCMCAMSSFQKILAPLPSLAESGLAVKTCMTVLRHCCLNVSFLGAHISHATSETGHRTQI